METTSLHREERGRWIILWHLLALVLVVLVPTMVRLGVPFWGLPQRMFPQVPVLAIGYLSTALFTTLAVRAHPRLSLGITVPIGVIAFGAPVVVLLELSGLDYSRGVLALGVALGLLLAPVPQIVRRPAMRVSLVPLALASVTMVSWAVAKTARKPAPDLTETIETVLHNVRITHETGLVGPAPISGGGLDLYGDGFIVANGIGELYRLTKKGPSLASSRIDVPSPLNRDAFIAANGRETEGGAFRVMDLLIDTVSVPNRILLSHYYWDSGEQCVALRVSATPVPVGGVGVPGPSWETLYTTKPCTPWGSVANGGMALSNEAGGRMAWTANGDLLLTVGGMRQRELAAYAGVDQPGDADYGRVLLIDRSGQARVVTTGHRNAEGLLVAPDGSMWLTEHGPRGGDELNRLAEGHDYGWPYATFGTEYDSNVWPLARGPRDQEAYEAPVYAWLPSVGVSNLLEVTREQFPAWKGDFVVGSLAALSLFRLRTLPDRVAYAERIIIGRHIRDLVEDRDGRILVWTDEADLVWLANAGEARTGEVVYSQCALCHDAGAYGPIPGPDLRGVVGRRAGSIRDFAYSPALEALDIEWTEETLDQFLRSPSAFAPGTTMTMEGLSESDRRSVIEFLIAYD